MDRLLTAIGRLLIVLFWLISIWMIAAGAYSVYGHTIGLEKYDVACNAQWALPTRKMDT